MSRRTIANLGVFVVVFGVMLWWAANNIVTITALEHPYKIVGEFSQAAGVHGNAEVAYLGVHYGRVASVKPTDRGSFRRRRCITIGRMKKRATSETSVKVRI